MGEQDEVREHSAVDKLSTRTGALHFFINIAEWGGTGTSPIMFFQVMLMHKRQARTMRKS